MQPHSTVRFLLFSISLLLSPSDSGAQSCIEYDALFYCAHFVEVGGSGSDSSDLAVIDGYAFVTTHPSYQGTAGGLAVVDLRDPLAGRLVAHINTPGRAIALAASKKHIFVADRFVGVQIVRIHCSGPPTFADVNTAELRCCVGDSGSQLTRKA
jgi:hypothetical protein